MRKVLACIGWDWQSRNGKERLGQSVFGLDSPGMAVGESSG